MHRNKLDKSIVNILESAGQISETDLARVVLVNQPDMMKYGAIVPPGSTFEMPPDQNIALREHANYVGKLRKIGANVVYLDELLMHGTMDESGEFINGEKLEAIRNLTRQRIGAHRFTDDTTLGKLKEFELSLGYFFNGKFPAYLENEGTNRTINGWMDLVVNEVGVETLIEFIKTSPQVYLRKEKQGMNTGIAMDHVRLDPLGNSYFMRDPIIAVPNGVVIARMNNDVRIWETKLLEFALESMGVPIVGRIKGDGRLEGGDWIPGDENYAFIGNGLRTNDSGIEQLFDMGAFDFPQGGGYNRVAVIKDPLRTNDEMHYDTWAKIPGHKKLIVLEDRRRGISVDSCLDISPVVNIYERQNDGSYKMIDDTSEFRNFVQTRNANPRTEGGKRESLRGVSFGAFLDHLRLDAGWTVRDGHDEKNWGFSKEHQLAYAPNGVAMGNETSMEVAESLQQYPELRELYNELGINIVEIPMKHINRGWGGPHCTTTVFRRPSGLYEAK